MAQVEDEDDTPEGVDMSDPFFNQDFGPDFPANNKRVETKTDTKKKGKKHSTETEEDKKRKVSTACVLNLP
jgi:hypothetical protein